MEAFDADISDAADSLKINYIEFPAQDFEAIQAFYVQAFGWRFIDYGPEYRAFSDGSLDGGFYKSDKHSATENDAALVILYAKNLEGALRRVVDAGGTIVNEIFEFPGGRRFQFTDPTGNQLAVWSNK
jgi:predicted enzyme related to lactoylglutathione lyase